MNTKKWLAVGSCVTALGLFSACSDDESSPITPPVVDSSSAIAPNSSDATPNSSADVGGSSSSNTTPAPTSSSNPEDTVLNADATYMGVSEIMYNAPEKSELEWVEVYIKSGPNIDNMQLSNVRLDGAVNFAFPAEPLKKGEYVIVANDVALFKKTYPTAACKVYGPWDNDPKTDAVAKLVNEGDVSMSRLKARATSVPRLAMLRLGQALQTARAERSCIKAPATKLTRCRGVQALLLTAIRALATIRLSMALQSV